MPFSWVQVKDDAVKLKIRRNVIMSKGGINSDFDIVHPDWIKLARWDGVKFVGNHLDLKLKTKDKIVGAQDRAIKRRLKRVGK